MKRILVVGTSGSGKTTVSRMIAAKIGLPHYASDDFYWEPGWHPAPIDRVNRLLDDVLAKPSWILDGNFEHRWKEVWDLADQVVWLDYSLPRVLWQVTCRNVGWYLSRQIIWSGNRFTLYRTYSGIRHMLRSYHRKRVAYPQYISQLTQAHVLRLTNRRQTRDWIATLKP